MMNVCVSLQSAFLQLLDLVQLMLADSGKVCLIKLLISAIIQYNYIINYAKICCKSKTKPGSTSSPDKLVGDCKTSVG